MPERRPATVAAPAAPVSPPCHRSGRGEAAAVSGSPPSRRSPSSEGRSPALRAAPPCRRGSRRARRSARSSPRRRRPRPSGRRRRSPLWRLFWPAPQSRIDCATFFIRSSQGPSPVEAVSQASSMKRFAAVSRSSAMARDGAPDPRAPALRRQRRVALVGAEPRRLGAARRSGAARRRRAAGNRRRAAAPPSRPAPRPPCRASAFRSRPSRASVSAGRCARRRVAARGPRRDLGLAARLVALAPQRRGRDRCLGGPAELAPRVAGDRRGSPGIAGTSPWPSLGARRRPGPAPARTVAPGRGSAAARGASAGRAARSRPSGSRCGAGARRGGAPAPSRRCGGAGYPPRVRSGRPMASWRQATSAGQSTIRRASASPPSAGAKRK